MSTRFFEKSSAREESILFRFLLRFLKLCQEYQLRYPHRSMRRIIAIIARSFAAKQRCFSNESEHSPCESCRFTASNNSLDIRSIIERRYCSNCRSRHAIFRSDTTVRPALELLQESQFVLIEVADIVNSMAHHTESGNPQPERESTHFFRIVSAR